MLSHRILVASCLVVAALTANPVWAQAPKPKDGPLGMKFVSLPKGTFYMGWNGTKKGVKTEIKEDFEIAIHTVTQGQWQEVMGKNPSYFSRDGGGKDQVKDIKDEDLKHFPVETVSWTDAQEFITKLNEKEKGKGYQYRLPIEAEWEYACRGGLPEFPSGSRLRKQARGANACVARSACRQPESERVHNEDGCAARPQLSHEAASETTPNPNLKTSRLDPARVRHVVC